MQQNNSSLSLNGKWDKHVIALILYYVIYSKIMKSFFPCSTVHYFNEVSQCQCISLFTYVSNVAADTTRLTRCYYIVQTLSWDFNGIQLATPWLPQLDILILHHYTCIIQNNLNDLCNHVDNKILHVCKSKVTSRGNITSCENAMSHGNSMSHLVEIFISTANLAFYT